MFIENHMTNIAFRIAWYLRNLFNVMMSRRYCICGAIMDRFGEHSLVCPRQTVRNKICPKAHAGLAACLRQMMKNRAASVGMRTWDKGIEPQLKEYIALRQGRELTAKEREALNERQGAHPNKRADVGLLDESDGEALMVDVCIAATCSKSCQKFNAGKDYDPTSAATLLEISKEKDYEKVFDIQCVNYTGKIYYCGVVSNGIPGKGAQELLAEMATWNDTDPSIDSWRMQQQLSVATQTVRAAQILTTLTEMSLDDKPTYPYKSGEMQIHIPPPTFKPVTESEDEYPIGIITQEKTKASIEGEKYLSRLHLPVYEHTDDLTTPNYENTEETQDDLITQSETVTNDCDNDCEFGYVASMAEMSDGNEFITQ
jgi:hypothetical protein